MGTVQRKIKFRVWNEKNQEIQDEDYFSCLGSMLEAENVMQYTGIDDINGVEIYEGDIINTDSGGKRIVIWITNRAGFMLVTPYRYTISPIYINFTKSSGKRKLEVLGNIFEDKELLR